MLRVIVDAEEQEKTGDLILVPNPRYELVKGFLKKGGM
jgi:hypothetical protein